VPNVTIKIGAALDADITALFAPIEKRAERARDVIAKLLGAGIKKGVEGAGAADALSDVFRDAIRDGIREGIKAGLKTPIKIPTARVPSSAGGGAGGPYRSLPGGAAAGGGSSRGVSEEVRAARQRAREESAAAREVQRDAWRRQNARERNERDSVRAADADARNRHGRADRFGAGVGGVVSRGLGTAAGIGADIARGAGLRFDIGGYVAANAEAQTRATDLSNSGYMPNAKGAAGIRQDPAALAKEAMTVASSVGMSQNDALAGLQAFVGKTGDLETARAVLKDLAMLSQATGTSLEDMVSAAGDASTELGDRFPSAAAKAEAVRDVMRAVAAQGKLGSVEIKDMATQMAKLTASSPQFAGTSKENIAMMGALAQEAKARGGAASATQAASSVQAFTSMLSTPARVKAMRAQGVDPVDKKTGMFRSAQDIITEAIVATKGDPIKLKKMFMNAAGARPAVGFANVYRKAGGGQEGIDAVAAEFDKLKKAAMGEGEIAVSFSEKMKSTAAQTQLANNRLQELTAAMQDRVVPQLLAFAPKLTEALTWATASGSNAIAAAAGAMVVKSGGEQAIKMGVEKLVSAIALAPGPFALLATAVVGATYAIDALDNYLEKSGYKEKWDKKNDVAPRDAKTGEVLNTHGDASKVTAALAAAGVVDPKALGATDRERRERGLFGDMKPLSAPGIGDFARVDERAPGGAQLAEVFGPPRADQPSPLPGLPEMFGPPRAPGDDKPTGPVELAPTSAELVGAAAGKAMAAVLRDAPFTVNFSGGPPVAVDPSGRTQ
jgi:hypothetical protein